MLSRVRFVLVTVLAFGLVAAAPAADHTSADHEFTVSPGDEFTVEGGAAQGINVTPLVNDSTTCGKDLDNYCETIYVEIDRPVPADENGDSQFAFTTISFDMTANVPGEDYDVFVYQSDDEGNKLYQYSSEEGVGQSANGPACAEICGLGVGDPLGFYGNFCDASDECVDFDVLTSTNAPTNHILIEVVYFAAASGYTGTLTATAR